MHSNVPDNPARGKAQGRIACPAKRALGKRTADGSRSPEVDAIRIPGRSLLQISLNSNRRSVTPTKINRGGGRGTNGTWARTGRNVEAEACGKRVLELVTTKQAWRVHPAEGANLRRAC